jgi:formylglycine-generating enzyme required for sulfatase activity
MAGKTRWELVTRPEGLRLLERVYVNEDGELEVTARAGVTGEEQVRVRRIEPDGREEEEELTVYLYRDYVNSLGQTFKRIEAGGFWMGSPEDEEGRHSLMGYSEEGPCHRVEILRPFELQETCVTRAQWRALMGEDPSEFQDGSLECPVETVSWEDGQRFIATLNEHERTDAYRFPTEAEWEYACRAGTQGPFSFEGSIDTTRANYHGGSSYAGSPLGEIRGRPMPVRSFAPNPWGLYEMHGNVWEWCADVLHYSYAGAPADGSAWTEGGNQEFRMVRGGSWGSHPGSLRAANRGSETFWHGDHFTGLRLVRTLPF